MGDGGRYRIQAVAELTGVPAATLRQWERRYGIPSPSRTASAYRLYGNDDIEDIRRLQALCADGLSPAEAARVVQAEATTRAEGLPAATVDDLDPYQAARRRVIEAVERYDHAALHAMARRLLYMGSAVAIFERVVAPIMREVGQRWHEGSISVAQEHLVSEALGQLVQQLLPIVQPEDAERVALLACFRDELHTLPLYGIAFRLAQLRHRAVVLGARTPPDALAAAVASIGPTVVGLSVTVAPAADEARALLGAYGAACGSVPWLVGGRGVRAIAPLVVEAGGQVAPADIAALDALLARIERPERRRSG